MGKESEATVIPQMRQVFRLTIAQLNALVGLRDGALGYATDETILYRQNGDGAANWEAITSLALAVSAAEVFDGSGNSPAALTDLDDFKMGLIYVDAVAVANSALTGSIATDGVASDGKIILCTAQSDAKENGPYLATDGGAWARAVRFNKTSQVRVGQIFICITGTVYAESIWINQNTVTTLGTTGDVAIQEAEGATQRVDFAALAVDVSEIETAYEVWFKDLPLGLWKEATNFDVSNIAANGGILASDTTPVLDAINAATDGCQRLLWASSNVDQIIYQLVLPPDFAPGTDVVLHYRILGVGTDSMGFTVDTFWNELDTKIVDTSTTYATAAWAEKTATIANADIPADARTLTIGLTPVGHGNDAMAISCIWLTGAKTVTHA